VNKLILVNEKNYFYFPFFFSNERLGELESDGLSEAVNFITYFIEKN